MDKSELSENKQFFDNIFKSFKVVKINKTIKQILAPDSSTNIRNCSRKETWKAQLIQLTSFSKIFQFVEQNIGFKKYYKERYNITIIGETNQNIFYQMKIKSIKINNEIKYFFALNDITDEKKWLQKEENNLFQQKLLQSFSHQIKTPLNNILPGLEMCLLDQEYPKTLKKKYLTNIYSGSLTLDCFLQDIISYFQILSNQFYLRIEQINFKYLIQRIKQQFKSALKLKNLKLNINFVNFSDELKINSDPSIIRQVISNLITNSIKFSDKHSKNITIQIEQLQEKSKLCINQKDIIMKISIIDQGIGMDQKQSNLLLDLLDNPIGEQEIYRQHNITGLSLGMRISQLLSSQLIQNSKRKKGLTFQTTQKKGTTFSFLLENLSIKKCNEISINTQKKAQRSTRQLENFQDTFIEEKNQNENKLFNEKLQYLSKNAFPNLLPQQRENSQSFNSFMSNVSNPTQDCLPKKEYRILIVDDDCFNLICLEQMLQLFPVLPIKAFNGEEAIDIVQEYHEQNELIDLILMDYQMPMMDGIESTKRISEYIESQMLNQIPIIGCSAFNGKEEVEEFLNAGAIKFINKPINIYIIESILKEFLGIMQKKQD